MNGTIYLTPQDYDQAKQNGISSHLLDYRVRITAWDKERAIITPVQKRNANDKWIKIAEENGISYVTFHSRIHALGWSLERASTEAILDRHKSMAQVAQGRRVYPLELLAKAKTNGISYATFQQRVYRQHWSMEDAATIPIMTKSEILRIKRNEYGIATRELREV